MASHAASVRAFNRFWTPLAGATARDYLGTGMSVGEARVLYEVAQAPGVTAQDVQARAGFDQGNLSRIIARLERGGWLARRRDPRDARRRALHTTAAGARLFRTMDARADTQAQALLARLPAGQRAQALAAMATLRAVLGDRERPTARIRRGRVGDLGWALMRQAELYHSEFGYSPVFERYVAHGLPPFLDKFDAGRDGLWLAELEGARCGCIAVQHDPERPGWAKLRWYFVEDWARGHGLGSRLLDGAVAFARKAGYTGIYLWTVDDLVDARKQYEKAGFALAEETGGCEWAPWGKEQRWELALRATRPQA